MHHKWNAEENASSTGVKGISNNSNFFTEFFHEFTKDILNLS